MRFRLYSCEFDIRLQQTDDTLLILLVYFSNELIYDCNMKAFCCHQELSVTKKQVYSNTAIYVKILMHMNTLILTNRIAKMSIKCEDFLEISQ